MQLRKRVSCSFPLTNLECSMNDNLTLFCLNLCTSWDPLVAFAGGVARVFFGGERGWMSCRYRSCRKEVAFVTVHT